MSTISNNYLEAFLIYYITNQNRKKYTQKLGKVIFIDMESIFTKLKIGK